jgi:membrane protease YdiL (CAAX protease family)
VDVRLRTLFTPHRPGIQAAAGGAGAALGLVAYLADADPRFEGSTASVVAALVAVAIVEEVVYRGLVQQTLERAVGRRGVLVATALFVSSYAGSGSTVLLLVLALAGLGFAVSVSSSGSLGGAVVGHAALALGVTVVWPELLDDAHRGVLPATPTAVALGLAIAAGVRFALRRRAGDPVAPAPSGG